MGKSKRFTFRSNHLNGLQAEDQIIIEGSPWTDVQLYRNEAIYNKKVGFKGRISFLIHNYETPERDNRQCL